MKFQILLFIIVVFGFVFCQKPLNSPIEYVDSNYFQNFRDTFSFETILKENDFGLPNIRLPIREYEASFYDDTLYFFVIDEGMCGGFVLKTTVIDDKFNFQLVNSPHFYDESLPIINQSLKLENKSFIDGETIKVEFMGDFLPYDYENSTLEKISVNGQLELTVFENANIYNRNL
ncbi:MAG: hypothetical protein AB8G11_26200 [Saprospiraceae bacterium]